MLASVSVHSLGTQAEVCFDWCGGAGSGLCSPHGELVSQGVRKRHVRVGIWRWNSPVWTDPALGYI